MKKLGFEVIPEDPCVFTKDGFIIFFYMDDIIFVYLRDWKKEVDLMEKYIKKYWELRDIGEASWFLGIYIIRDTEYHYLYLC